MTAFLLLSIITTQLKAVSATFCRSNTNYHTALILSL